VRERERIETQRTLPEQSQNKRDGQREKNLVTPKQKEEAET
jgi:hypothetical protein